MSNRLPAALAAAIAALCCGLAGCSSRTDVSLTGNTPARFSHVWITTQEVWFNTSAIAGPDDGGWVKFPLSAPATVDLVVENGGSLGSIVTGLKLTPGTYSQVRLIAVDPSTALTSTAQAAGALYNTEADYVDSSGTTHQLPLELLSPDKGIGIQGSLKVPVGDIGKAVAASTAALGSNTAANTTFGSPIGTNTGTTNGTTIGTTNGSSTGATTTGTTTTGTTTFGVTSGTTTPTTTTTASVPPTEFAVNFNGGRDLVQFSYPAGGTSAVMLSSHATAYDLTQVGAIQGTLTLTNLTGTSSVSGLSATQTIQASAQVLSADGTRHVVVSSTPVHSDGTFTLYPLAAGSSTPVDYDVVIHGPGIATIIIKSVAVTLASTSTSTGTTQTNTQTTTTTTSPGTTITPVSVGTLIPRAATSFTANLAAPTSLPSDATVSFYQTLASAGQVPYVIETSPIDPFNQVLANAQELSTGTIDSGTWSSSGAAVTLVSAAPAEGAGRYIVAAGAPSFTEGTLTTTVSPPLSGTATVPVILAGLTLASGASSGSISATVTQATAGKYDQGELLVSHDGTLVASASLAAALAPGSGALTVNGVPAGTSAALYYVSVRTWSSRDPSGTLHRQSYTTVVDLRGGTSGAIQLSIN
jgi:hypothetical protein